jgi:curved DNA-binding protein CbpA
MPEMQPDHYETLGLTPASTQDQIKKRYRELARRYHPDINPDPAAVQKIKTINEAYRVLGDPDLRATYDAQIVLSRHQAKSASSTTASEHYATPSNPPRPARPTSDSASSWNGRAEYNGFGRTAPDGAPLYNAPQSASPRSRARKPAEPVEKVLERLIGEAQLAYINRRYPQAEALCLQALRLDHRNPVLHEILGDVYVRLGDTERAQTAFTFAIQFNPHNRSAQTKLERLMGLPFRGSPGPTMTRPSVQTRQRKDPLPMGVLHLLSSLFTMILIAALFLYFHGLGGVRVGGGESSPGTLLDLLLTLLVCGVSAGGLLALNGGMRPISDELWSRGLDGDHPRYPLPLGVLLGVSSLLWFYLSFLLYIGLVVSRNRFSPSILLVYAVTLLLTVLFTFLTSISLGPISPLLIAALIGNAIFPAMLLGWFLGDVFRLRGRLSASV